MCKIFIVLWLTFPVSLPLTSPTPDVHLRVSVPIVQEVIVPCMEPPPVQLRKTNLERKSI